MLGSLTNKGNTTSIQIQIQELLLQLAEQLSTEYRSARQKNSSGHKDQQR